MKIKGIHEGCIEQIKHLFAQKLYNSENVIPLDEAGRIRIDDWEMREDVQQEVWQNWELVTTENAKKTADLRTYTKEFKKLFWFGFYAIDYHAETDEMVDIEGLI